MTHSRKSDIVAQLRAVTEMRENLQAKYQTDDKELTEQEKALLTQLEAVENAPTPPVFDAKQRTIQWHDGCQKLSPQRYKILDALRHAEHQELMLNDLEMAVWGAEVDINLGTIKTAVCRLGIVLNDSKSPFLIESVLSEGGEPMEISDRKGVRTVKTHPSLLGFRLITRVTENCNACGTAE